MAEQVEVRRLLRSIGSLLARGARERPYPVLALAAAAGYVAGGGLFSPVTRPLVRAAVGALLVPGSTERLRRAWRELLEVEGAVTGAT